jgi:hypothetical protein
MSQARRLRYVNQYAARVEPLPFDQPWAWWQEKGVRDDARVGRNIRLVAAIALALGVIWLLA